MQRRSPDKIGAWELLLLIVMSVLLCVGFSDDTLPPQPVNSYSYPHKLSDADFLDGAPVVNAAQTQEAGR